MRIAIALVALAIAAGCAPRAPAHADVPVSGADFRVTTTPSIADQRFLVEFKSLSQRDLCIGPDQWPTAQGELNANAEGETHHVLPGDVLSAVIRFDQVPPASRTSDGAHQFAFAPQPVFCPSDVFQ